MTIKSTSNVVSEDAKIPDSIKQARSAGLLKWVREYFLVRNIEDEIHNDLNTGLT